MPLLTSTLLAILARLFAVLSMAPLRFSHHHLGVTVLLLAIGHLV